MNFVGIALSILLVCVGPPLRSYACEVDSSSSGGIIAISDGFLRLTLPREAILKGFSTETRFLDQIVVKRGIRVFRFVDVREASAAVIGGPSKPKNEPDAGGAMRTVEYVIATDRIAIDPSTVDANTGDTPKLAALLYDPNVKLFVALRDSSGKPVGKSRETTIPLVTDLQANKMNPRANP